jgi:hypothetical protein
MEQRRQALLRLGLHVAASIATFGSDWDRLWYLDRHLTRRIRLFGEAYEVLASQRSGFNSLDFDHFTAHKEPSISVGEVADGRN